jgi:cytochrome c oxidase subunit II
MFDSFLTWFQRDILRLPLRASAHGASVDNMLSYVHWLMFALFIGWLGYFLYALFRFRASRAPRASHVGVRSHLSSYLEVGVAGIEAFLLLAFAVPLWAKVVSHPPSEQEATVIHVMGRQFNWMVHYAGADGVFGKQDPALSNAADPFGVDRKNDPNAVDDVVVQGNLVVPVNRYVVVHLTALDVIHSFAIPAMRVCQDAIPGLSIPTWFKPVQEGDYKVTCAQLCGNSHYGMFATLKVVSQAEFDRWLKEQSAKARSASAGPVNYE